MHVCIYQQRDWSMHGLATQEALLYTALTRARYHIIDVIMITYRKTGIYTIQVPAVR